LGEVPGVPFGITAVIATLAVVLIYGLIDDFCASCSRLCAVLVHVVDVHAEQHGRAAVAA
jgi:hypothetical protein